MAYWPNVARLCVWGLLSKSTTRYYATKISRRPIRVLPNEELIENKKQKLIVEESRGVSSEKEDVDGEPVILEGKKSRLPPGFPPYEIKGNDDCDLSRFAMDTACRQKRQKSALIMLEGKRLICEALQANVKPRALFFSRVEDVTSMQFPPQSFIFQKITYQKLKRWTKVNTAPGVLGFFSQPNTSCQKTSSSLPFSIICDNIRDPGNLGSVLRVAASSGCKRVFLTKGCVDLWNEKVLRAAMGSHFHICIEEKVEWHDIEYHLRPDSFVIYADNKDTTEIFRDDVYHTSALRNTDHSGTSEDTEMPVEETGSFDSSEVDKKLPIFPYYEVAYSQMNDIFLVIGGETEGLSSKGVQFGKSHKSLRVNIPMLNNVESLNVSSALAILTHEIKRQFTIEQQMLDSINTVTMPPV